MDEDKLVIRTKRTLPGLRRSVFGMYCWAPTRTLFFVAAAVFAILLAIGDPRGHAENWWGLAIGICTGLCLFAWQHLGMAKRLYLKAQTHGAPVFFIGSDGIRSESTDMKAEIAWCSIHSVCVSSHTLYVFTTRSCAWFIGRGEYDYRVIQIAREAGVRVRGRLDPRL